MSLRLQIGLFAFAGAVVVSACETQPVTSSADLPYSLLGDRVGVALGHVEDARTELDAARAPEAAERLADASASLRQVLDYYLPLIEARARVRRAAELAVTTPTASRAAIDTAHAVLDAVATGHGEHLALEMREPLARLEDARTALESERGEDARRILDRLGQQLEVLYFRGGLVLEGSELDAPPRDSSD